MIPAAAQLGLVRCLYHLFSIIHILSSKIACRSYLESQVTRTLPLHSETQAPSTFSSWFMSVIMLNSPHVVRDIAMLVPPQLLHGCMTVSHLSLLLVLGSQCRLPCSSRRGMEWIWTNLVVSIWEEYKVSLYPSQSVLYPNKQVQSFFSPLATFPPVALSSTQSCLRSLRPSWPWPLPLFQPQPPSVARRPRPSRFSRTLPNPSCQAQFTSQEPTRNMDAPYQQMSQQQPVPAV